MEAVFSVIEKYEAEDFPISVAGSPVVVAELKRNMMHDMRKFMVMAIVIVGAMLFVMFRRVSGVIFPFIDYHRHALLHDRPYGGHRSVDKTADADSAIVFAGGRCGSFCSHSGDLLLSPPSWR